MMMALKDKPDVPFRVPPGIKLISVDAKTGVRSSGSGTILEAFKPGTGPPESFAYGGEQQVQPKVLTVDPNADRSLSSGTGGLY